MEELAKEHPADIRDLSHNGLGVATVHNKTVFIEGALPGEQVNFVYVQKKSKFNIGKTTEILKLSSIRSQPECSYYGTCGGCSMQHVNSNAQIEIKQNRFLKQLKHVGGVSPEILLPAVLGPSYSYRRRARFAVQWNQKNQIIELGYKAKQSHRLVPIDHCEILASSLSAIIPKLQTILSQLSIRKDIIQLEMAMGDEQLAVLLQHKGILPVQDKEALTDFAKNEKISFYSQQIFSADPSADYFSASQYPIQTIWKIGNLNYSLTNPKLTFAFHAWDFVQANATVNQSMISQVMKILNPKPTDIILDLFCGIGNFTLPLAGKAKQVIGIEGDSNLVTRAQENASLNNLHNAEFFQCNLLQKTTLTGPWVKPGYYHKIILDPPRTGAVELMQLLVQLKAKHILYIACDPATLARDIKILSQQGYYFKSAGILDMFPQTSHMECMAFFELP